MIVHQTSRLLLETWALDDFDAFAEMARDPEVMRHIAEGKPWPDSRIGWFLGRQDAFQNTLGYCNWKLISRDTGAFIGFCGIAPLSMTDAPEIGWWLKPAHWRRGYAFEAAQCVLDAAFGPHELDQVVARAYQSNRRSIRLIERLGMTYERNLEKGALGEIQLFGLKKVQWVSR